GEIERQTAFFVSCVIKVREAKYSGIGNEHHEYDRADTMFEKLFKTENNRKPHKFSFKHFWHILNKHPKWNPEMVHRSIHEMQV
ncbi:hypothetical protein GIB67_031015, partial [Kingdonia uniflora]